MMWAKAFQAQSLDNSSQDHLRLAGVADELCSPKREQTYSAMAAITTQGEVLFARDGVRLFVKGCSAVLQVVAEERDHAGRLAPVMCWIERDGLDVLDGPVADSVWASLVQFSAAIGRSFSESTRSAACGALDLFEKKKRNDCRIIVLKAKAIQVRLLGWFKRALALLQILMR